MPALGGVVLTGVLFLVAPRGPAGRDSTGPGIAAWVTRPSTGRAWAPAPEEVLAEGDELQLQVNAGSYARITLYRSDANGAFSFLHSQKVTGTSTLPLSVVLDEAPGPFTLYAVFSMRPVPEVTREQLQGERVELDGDRIEVRKLLVRRK